MYSIAEKWYGILFCDGQKKLDPSIRPFLADLCKLLDDLCEPDFFGNGSDDKPVRIDYATATTNELFDEIRECDILHSSYSGDGEAPYGIAVDIESFPCWEIQNIIQSDRDSESQRTDAEKKFKNYLSNYKTVSNIEISVLLDKYGIKPDFVWTTSTS